MFVGFEGGDLDGVEPFGVRKAGGCPTYESPLATPTVDSDTPWTPRVSKIPKPAKTPEQNATLAMASPL